MKISLTSALLALSGSCTTPNPDYRPPGGACTEHKQCGSRVCRPDKTCSDGKDVAYVDPEGDKYHNSPSVCTQSSPCFYVGEAVDKGRPYVKLTGTTVLAKFTWDIKDRKVDILADPGAALTRTFPGPLMTVLGSSRVAIYDLEFTGAIGFAGHAIFMPADNQSTVSLERVTIDGNAGSGIYVDQTGTLSIRQSTIRNSGTFGVDATGAAVQVVQSTIENNTGGGIRVVSPADLDIANNFIVQNGNESSMVGGVLVKAGAGSSTRKLEFNTVADNAVQQDQPAGGVMCYGNVQTSANLIFQNAKGGATYQVAQTDGDCAPSSTSAAAPAFRSATDYHLTAATPGSIRDAFDCAGGVDFDGDQRPQGGKCDLGADEFRP